MTVASKLIPEPTRIIGQRVSDFYPPGPTVVTSLPCRECRELVWLSPASISAIAGNRDAQVVCIQCMIPIMAEAERSGEPIEFVATAEQDQEMREATGITQTEALRQLGIIPKGRKS